MKSLASHTTWLGGLAAAFLLMMFTSSNAHAGEMKLEAQLIWGTNDEKPSDPDIKEVDPKLEKKLKKSPFKWKHYFEVNRKKFSVKKGESQKVEMSKDCEIEVHNLSDDVVELTLFGKGKSVGTIKQGLPKGELLVTGGNAENLTAWFVVLRQVE